MHLRLDFRVTIFLLWENRRDLTEYLVRCIPMV